MSSELKVDTISEKTSAGGVTVDGVLIKDNKLASGTGNVLQVVSGTDSSGGQITATTQQDTGLSASITPSSTSSKILVLVNHNVFTWAPGAVPFTNGMQLVRGSTAICIGDSDSSNRVECSQGGAFQSSNNDKVSVFSLNHVDSPNTTSATTYKLQCQIYGTSKTLTVNRTFNDSDSTFTGRGASTITAYEIAG